jgi:tetratricopeptide (TPR) repeat protein
VKKKSRINFFVIISGLALDLLLSSCSNQSSVSSRYLNAEKLWSEKNYQAAAVEFDQILKEDPNSAIALQALLRSSMTKSLFLNQPDEALKGLRLYLDKASSSDQVPLVEKEIGEILFNRLRQFNSSINHYEKLLKQDKYTADDKILFQYRIARSHFLLGQVNKSIDLYQELIKNAPKSKIRIRSILDLAQALYAIGDTEKTAFQNAMNQFNLAENEMKQMAVVSTDPYFAEAEFGMAAIMEEQDQLEQAYEKFKSLEQTYPAKNVVKIRLLRLEDRLKKKRK